MISATAVRFLSTTKTLKSVPLFSRGLQTLSLPDLSYGYGALEPAISGEIMQIHHQKHHQSYITNYNYALEQLNTAIANGADPSTVVKLQSTVNFNGGGHINHSIFWKSLAPVSEGGGDPPVYKSALGFGIYRQLDSVEGLIEKMTSLGIEMQGSGWVWLAFDKEVENLVGKTTANQDPLVSKGTSLIPLMGIDVWEHAYYLQYKNARLEYLQNIWKVINWKYAGEIYEKECLMLY